VEFLLSGIVTGYMGMGMAIIFNPKDQWIGISAIFFGLAQVGYGISIV